MARNPTLGYGGTDIVAILGIYGSAFELYQVKTGAKEPEDLSEVYNVNRGNALEPLLAEWYSRDQGVDLVCPGEQVVCATDEDFVVCPSPDGLELCEPDCPLNEYGKEGVVRKGVDFKATKFGAHKYGEPWTGQVPEEVNAQCQFYIWAFKPFDNRWEVCADLPFEYDPCIFVVERDDFFIGEVMVPALQEFDWRVKNKKPPEPTDSNEVLQLYPEIRSDALVVNGQDPDEELEPGEALRVWKYCMQMRAAKKTAEEAYKEAVVDLQQLMGPHPEMVLSIPGQKPVTLCTWRADRRFDADAFGEKFPHLVDQYATKLDTTALRKAHKKEYERCMVPAEMRRTLRFREPDGWERF